MPHAQIPALTDSTRSQQLNVLLAPLSAQLAQDQQQTVHHASTDQCQQTDHAQCNVVRTNSVSEDSVLLVQRDATDARELLKTVSTVLLDMSRLDQLVKKDVFLINSMTEIQKDALLVDLDAPLVQLTTIAPPAKTQPSTLEVEFAPTVLTHVPLVTEPEPAHHASVDSSTSKDHAKLLVLMELLPSTESANVNQESFPWDNV